MVTQSQLKNFIEHNYGSIYKTSGGGRNQLGGQKVKTARQVFDKNPSDLIERAVKGMLPKNKLGAVIFKNLRVYDDENHNQSSQNPKQININEF